jgi:type I restriction enzyme S subunit
MSWVTTSWSDVCTLHYGKALKNYKHFDSAYPVYGSGGIVGSTDTPIAPAKRPIVARKGTLTVYWSEDASHIIDTAYWLEPKETLDPHWAYFAVKNLDISTLASGTGVPSLSRDDFYREEIALPPLADQKAIAHILGSLDDKIELNQKMNQTLEEIARAIFRSWFVDFDPVRAKAEGRPTGLPPEISDLFPDKLVDSEIGEIPMGWKLSTLSEVFDIQGGSQPPAKTFIDEEKDGYVRLLQIRDYDNSNHKTYIPAKKNLRLVDEDDVLIGRYGSGNGKFMEDSLGRPLRGLSGAINVAVVRTIPKLENSREFIATMVSSGLFYKWIVGGSARAVQAGFKKDDLDYIKLSVPSSEILLVYEEFGALVWKRTKAFREENRILSELRDTLLPKLISGELRIPDAEKFLKEAGI